MNKSLTALTAISLLLAPAAFAEGKTYKAKDFSRIEVSGAMKVVFKTAPTTSIFVESSNGDYSDSRIANKGDTLVVSRESLKAKRGLFSWGGRSVSVSADGNVVKVNGKKMPVYTVYVTGPDLDSVTASQSSRFESKTIDAGAFQASASSSSTVILAGKATTARLSASSSGEMMASEFAAGTLTVSASSSGEADVFTSGTGDTNIDASSSGEVDINSASAASFVVNASSGGTVELAGSCSRISVSASSGASVEGGELRCNSASVSVSSGADVEAYASGSASGSASSGGSVSFSGKPGTQEVSKSSGGSVSFTG